MIAATRLPGNSEVAILRPLTVALMLVVGVMGFVGMLVLGAYAPDLRSGRNGGTHALSDSATGFSGLYRLAEATGRNPRVIRDVHQMDTADLLVLSPPDGTTDVSVPVQTRVNKPTLMILPKWNTKPDPATKGWVRYVAPFARWVPEGVLAPATKLKVVRVRSDGAPLVSNVELYDSRLNLPIRFTAPRPLQTVAADTLRPIIVDRDGRIVLGEVGTSELYILADPDLLSNRGIGDANQALAALGLLDFLNVRNAKGIAFDVTLNGLGHSPSPLKLAFDPPFLAMTLAIAAALLLAALHALGRFGAPETRARAIAFGKAALVDNTAALVRKARREAAMGPRYAQVIRERASAAFGVPARFKGAAADFYLDRLARRGTFTDLVARADAADDKHSVLAAAQALHDWQEETR